MGVPLAKPPSEPARGEAAARQPAPTEPAAEAPKPAMTRRQRMREELYNAPNLVTFARMALIPAFLFFLTIESRRNSFLAAVIFTVASLTDALDGYLARSSNKITTLGKFLDPLADKLIALSALVMLLKLGRVPSWVVVVTLGRELLISGLRTIAVSEGVVIAASQGGKWKTFLQLTAIVALMVHYHYAVDYGFFAVLTDFQAVGMALLYISLVPSLLSAAEYVRGFYVLDGGGGGRGAG